MSDDPIVLGTTKSIRTTVDGGMIATFEIAPQDVQKAFQAFGLAGSNVGIAPLTAKAAQAATVEAAKTKHERTTFTKLPRATQAALRCAEPDFWAFLRSVHLLDVASEDEAAFAVRRLLMVESRKQLNEPGPAERWDALEGDFYAWQYGRH